MYERNRARSIPLFGAIEENDRCKFLMFFTRQEYCPGPPSKPRAGRAFSGKKNNRTTIAANQRAECAQRLHRKCRKREAQSPAQSLGIRFTPPEEFSHVRASGESPPSKSKQAQSLGAWLGTAKALLSLGARGGWRVPPELDLRRNYD